MLLEEWTTMKLFFSAMLSVLMLSGPSIAHAESLMVDYVTRLGKADAYNSKRQPLNDLCAIVQQDRANWHRFFKREEFDSGDPFFDSANKRAMLAGKCEYDDYGFYNIGQLIRNNTKDFYVQVRVYGNYGKITRVVVTELAG
jgi:hypothetical protein